LFFWFVGKGEIPPKIANLARTMMLNHAKPSILGGYGVLRQTHVRTDLNPRIRKPDKE